MFTFTVRNDDTRKKEVIVARGTVPNVTMMVLKEIELFVPNPMTPDQVQGGSA